jgi:hypothetical protein
MSTWSLFRNGFFSLVAGATAARTVESCKVQPVSMFGGGGVTGVSAPPISSGCGIDCAGVRLLHFRASVVWQSEAYETNERAQHPLQHLALIQAGDVTGLQPAVQSGEWVTPAREFFRGSSDCPAPQALTLAVWGYAAGAWKVLRLVDCNPLEGSFSWTEDVSGCVRAFVQVLTVCGLRRVDVDCLNALSSVVRVPANPSGALTVFQDFEALEAFAPYLIGAPHCPVDGSCLQAMELLAEANAALLETSEDLEDRGRAGQLWEGLRVCLQDAEAWNPWFTGEVSLQEFALEGYELASVELCYSPARLDAIVKRRNASGVPSTGLTEACATQAATLIADGMLRGNFWTGEDSDIFIGDTWKGAAMALQTAAVVDTDTDLDIFNFYKQTLKWFTDSADQDPEYRGAAGMPALRIQARRHAFGVLARTFPGWMEATGEGSPGTFHKFTRFPVL